MKMKIGWIGTGVMGKSMCLNLIKGGCSAMVFSRTKAKAQALIDAGAGWADSPREVAKASDVIFTMVGMPSDVQEVILGEKGLLAGAAKGSVIVDMSTSEPALACRIFEEAKAKGVKALDAPVSGGDVGARDGTLAVMVGGDRAVFDEILPLFQLMGKAVSYMGQAGSGQHTKMCNQTVAAMNMLGAVEALLYAQKAGLEPEAMIGVVGKGAAGSFAVNNTLPRILAGNFNPGFFLKHFVKDMGIALAEAKRMNLSLPGLSLVHQFYVAAMALGFENLGTQGIYKVCAMLNNVK